MFGSNFNPDWNDTEGALRRRLVFFLFSNSIEEKDSSLIDSLFKERGSIIFRCVREYLKFVAENKNEADFNKFLGPELQSLKDDFKEFSDPLSEFLSLGKTKIGQFHYSVVYKEGDRALVTDFKKRFEHWLSSSKHD